MIDTAVSPVDQTVKAVAYGEDCVHYFVVPISAGETTVEQAMLNAEPERIAKLRSVKIVSRGYPFFGKTCTAVDGEPKDWTAAKAAAVANQPLTPGMNN